MPLIDTTQFDFSDAHPTEEAAPKRTATVRNDDSNAVLHVGVKSPADWIEIYPAEFALAPNSAQILVTELHPERAKNSALAPISANLFGQYLTISGTDAENLPSDIELQLNIIPPISSCPTCGATLPEGARECRRCGERIRLCALCATPNTWIAKVCRRNPAHILRAEQDWLMTPGGNAAHDLSTAASLGVQLARRWSYPSFPVTEAANAFEWSAPLTAFGMVIASAIDSLSARAFIQAFDITTGAALWDFDLTDPKGIYPDRGGMAIAGDGTLYAATLGGHVMAIDSIRGTLRWSSTIAGSVYGGVTVTADYVLVPADLSLYVLDRHAGTLLRQLKLGGRLDTSAAATDTIAYITSDDKNVYAFDLEAGDQVWRTTTQGPFNAAPILRDGIIYAATMTGVVYALDAADGSVKWNTKASTKSIAVTPSLSVDGLLFVAADDGFLHIIAAHTGNMIRSRRVSGSPLRSSPICSGGSVFIGADDGNVYSMDTDYNIHHAYDTTPGSRIATAGLALYGDLIVCASTNGVLYVLRATS